MRHAVLLIDDYTVANYKWNVSEGSWFDESQATHRLTFKVPPKKDALGSRQVWIDVETMGHGRLRCPTPFVYREAEKSQHGIFNLNFLIKYLQKVNLPRNYLKQRLCATPVSVFQIVGPDEAFASPLRVSGLPTLLKRYKLLISISAAPLKAVSPPNTEARVFVRNSSIRLSDTRGHRGAGGAKPSQPILPPTNEIPNGLENRSSGLGSEESFSEMNPQFSSLSTAVNSSEGKKNLDTLLYHSSNRS